MTDISLPFPLAAGTPENVNQLMADLDRLKDGLNLAVDSGLAELAGLSIDAGTVRRGKSIIATEESRTNTAYGTLTTPDQVANVVLPTDGLIVVSYQALWKQSVLGAARATIFIGSNQAKLAGLNAVPSAQECQLGSGGSANFYAPLHTGMGAAGVGLISPLNPGANAGPDVSTGQFIGHSGAGDVFGGDVSVFATAGTYTVSVQFKASSGSVTAKDRKLWVEAKAY